MKDLCKKNAAINRAIHASSRCHETSASVRKTRLRLLHCMILSSKVSSNVSRSLFVHSMVVKYLGHLTPRADGLHCPKLGNRPVQVGVLRSRSLAIFQTNCISWLDHVGISSRFDSTLSEVELCTFSASLELKDTVRVVRVPSLVLDRHNDDLLVLLRFSCLAASKCAFTLHTREAYFRFLSTLPAMETREMGYQYTRECASREML